MKCYETTNWRILKIVLNKIIILYFSGGSRFIAAIRFRCEKFRKFSKFQMLWKIFYNYPTPFGKKNSSVNTLTYLDYITSSTTDLTSGLNLMLAFNDCWKNIFSVFWFISKILLFKNYNMHINWRKFCHSINA